MFDISVEEWGPEHVRWQQLLDLVIELGQMDWLTFRAKWHASSHILVLRTTNSICH